MSKPIRMALSAAAPALAAFGILAGLGSLLGGGLTFTQDDPYIHLAVAEQILHGGYGINEGEAAAPASSILFPLLLVPGVALGIPVLWALLLNAAGLAALGGLVVAAIGESAGPRAVSALLIGSYAVGIGLAGMEHVLHAAATAACIVGVARTVERGRAPRTPWWLPAAAVLALALRFEGVVVWGGVIAALLVLRKWRGAALTMVAGVVLLGGFAAVMQALELPVLPSSVTAKSSTVGGGTLESVARGIGATLRTNLLSGAGELLVVAVALCGLPLLRRERWRSGDAIVWLLLAATVAGHLVGSRVRHLARYELYLVFALVVGGGWLWREVVPRQPRGVAPLGWVLALLVAAANPAGLYFTLTAPLGMRSIALQHGEMHRFATAHWKGPIAVNDIGRVSFENPHYVLDLVGLANEEIRSSLDRVATFDRLAREHEVGVALVYPHWFDPDEELPASWLRVGRLTVSEPVVGIGGPVVEVYATSDQTVDRVVAALDDFVQGVPSGVRVEIERPGREGAPRVSDPSVDTE